jgi:hypothetical protein
MVIGRPRLVWLVLRLAQLTGCGLIRKEGGPRFITLMSGDKVSELWLGRKKILQVLEPIESAGDWPLRGSSRNGLSGG